MKAYIYILFIAILGVSCNGSNTGSKDDQTDSTAVADTSTAVTANTDKAVEILENVPIYQGRVTDYFGLFTDEEKEDLVSICQKIDERTGVLTLVLITPDLAEEDINAYSSKVARAWHATEGIIIVVAPKEGNLRLEIGENLKEIVTNNISQQIVNTHIAPNFPEDKYFEGVKGALGAIDQALPSKN